MKPIGWRREPARHALAAKGIESGRTESGALRALLPSTAALRSQTTAIKSELKKQAVEDLVERALAETNGDEEKAVDLIQNQCWFDQQAKTVAREHSQGRMAKELERELKLAFADVSKPASNAPPAEPEAEPEDPTQ